MMTAILLAGAYIAGSVNFSILVFRMLGRDDPRDHFSATAGTTNVYRQAGLFWAAVILILDTGRAFAVGAVALSFLDPPLVPWIGLGLVVGNRYPCFHGFQGGKGVASYVGFTAALSPVFSALSCIFWVLAYSVFRLPFMASFFMVLTLAAGTIIAYNHESISVFGVLSTAAFICYNHKDNVLSLMGKRDKNDDER
jgi:glycerol-3-phosphate acyltransferase PlsY